MKGSLTPRFILAALAAAVLFAFCLNAVGIQHGAKVALGVFAAVVTLPALINPPSFVLRAVATAEVDTPTREGEYDYLPLAAATKIFQGVLVAVDANGRAVNASDTAALRVIGRAEATVDNTSGAAGDLFINVRRGIFRYTNSATNAITAAHFNKPAYVEDHQTVANTSTNKIIAGQIRAIDSEGIWIDTRRRAIAAAVALASVQEATANGSDAATTQALANSLKAKYNTLQTDVAGIKAALEA